MKTIKHIVLAIAMLLNTNLFADVLGINTVDETPPKRSLHGQVFSNGDPLPFATILIKGTTIGTATDANGQFYLHHLPNGNITVVASAVGYGSSEIQVDEQSPNKEDITIELQEKIITTDEVVVSASRNTVKRKDAPVLVNTIGIQLLENVQAISLVEGLNFTPGLRVENDCQNCGFTQVRLNGLEGSYSQILINSRPIFSTMAGVYGLEQLPINMIDKIEVVRGGGSSLFGSNAIGGTINIITKDPLSNQYSLGSNFGLINGEAPEFNVNASASVSNDDNSSGIFLYGNVRKRDHWDANNDGYSELPEIKANNIGLRAYYRPGNYSKINLDFGATKEFRRGGNKFDEMAHQADIAEQLNHDILNGGLTFDQYSKNGSNKLSVYTSAQYVSRDSYYGAEQDPSAYGQTDDIATVTGIQETHEWDNFLRAKSTTTTGGEYLFGSLNDNKLGYYDAEADTNFVTKNITDQLMSTYAAYAQNEWNWTKVKLLLGVRYDHVIIEDNAKEYSIGKKAYPNWNPRVNIVYQPNKHLSIRGNFSSGFRAPQIFSEDLHIESSGLQTIVHINDPDLSPEKSISFTGGFDYDFNLEQSEFELIAEGFYTHLKNPFAPEYDFDDEKKIMYEIRKNAKDGAVVQGVNIEFNWAYNSKMDIQSGFTYQSSKFESAQAWGNEESNVSEYMTRTPEAYGYLVYTYYPSRFFSGSLNMNYTGKMYVPHFMEEGEELVHTNSFLDMGVKLAYKVMVGNMTFLELSGGVKNIFNSYQNDFDRGVNRDSGYIYGPSLPRTYFIGLELRNFL